MLDLLGVKSDCRVEPLNVHLFIFLLKFSLELVKNVASSVAAIVTAPMVMVMMMVMVMACLGVSILVRFAILGGRFVPRFDLAVHIILLSLCFLNLVMLEAIQFVQVANRLV